MYAVHEEIVEGKKKRRKCYLGPADSYAYVSMMHDLDFYGLIKEDRYITYLEEILSLFASEEPVSIDPEEFKRDFENIMKMRSLVKKISNKIDDRLRKIIETMISDVKASIDVLKRDYANDPKAIELVKELEGFDREIEKYNLPEEYVYLESVTIRSFVEKYLELKQKLRQFNL